MNLFDKEFFPTPLDVIRKMAAPYAARLETATVLEPSAGNGAILDAIIKDGVFGTIELSGGKKYEARHTANKDRVYAIEQNPELQMILQQKGYRVIASDFLSFQPEHRFNLILMNPPFSNGDTHLLHAWEILRNGDIACLLNAETVRNPYSASRKRLAAIIADNGSVEYIGRVFAGADNQTDVDVALVRLHKETADDPFKIDIEGLTKENAPDFGTLAQESDQIAVSNQLDAYIRCWSLTKAAAVDFIKSFARLRFFASTFLPQQERGENVMEGLLKTLGDVRFSNNSMASVYNQFLDRAKSSAWGAIFDQIGLGKYMTTGLKQKLDDFRTAQGAMEISKENINLLFRFIMSNLGTIMDQSVTEVYDLFTRYFKGNTACDEGWKTNKRFKCNRKVILPNAVSAGFMPQRYGYDTYYRVEYGNGRNLEDIDKAMCWLSGRSFDLMDNSEFSGSDLHRRADPEKATIRNVISTIKVGDQGWHESAFFRVKAFKKGTIHLEFKDEALWTKFNLAVNQGKNQLGMAE